jgi:hypothetical protein
MWQQHQHYKRSSRILSLYVSLIKSTLQKELDKELAKHKGNEDEIKRLEKQHKKGIDELHVNTPMGG